ncbi:putative phosphosugar-binding protein [Stackebrandtia albiflava]|uniref:Putative phosphosugar-binding protein n=1 Tax=Stackebrandtia albiflava TaxID=406432 RepID=A0A562VBY4_9ACTN|nr:SIS domain-containing protein [Stackebrandtia albiflava]TWJ15321.1 putative phosphosugar-binding protein [Stackebrandtia albiflava]
MNVSAEGYAAALRGVLDQVVATQMEAVGRAADLVVESLAAGGILQAFGTGHSEALTMELAGRAGGLVPTNRIALRDLVLRGGEPVDLLTSDKLERDPQIARRLFALADAHPSDVFVIASQSGINGSIVEFAAAVKEAGHRLIAFTSRQQSEQTPSRHPSGRRLLDYADVVLDNCAPYGDSLLPLPAGGSFGAASSISAALLAQMVVAEVVRRQLDAGETPPVYLSANVPGGDEHNHALESRYAGRIRRGA